MNMGPRLALLGIVAILIIWGVAIYELPPESAAQLTISCATIFAVLVNIIKQSHDAKAINDKIDDNTAKTETKAEEVKATIQEKGSEVKKALKEADAEKNNKLDSIAAAVDTVVLQTNGIMTKKLDEIQNKVEEVQASVNTTTQ